MINEGITRISLGSFTNKLTLFRNIQRKNKRGAVENDYQFEREIFAKVVEVASAEQDMDNNLIALNSIEVTTYILPQITTGWRIGYNGNLYDIISTNRVENQPLIVIKATQIMQ